MRLTELLVAVALVAATSASIAFAADKCYCSHCGCANCCQKVCRLVCEEKKVDIICWGCKCEDFCLPSPSKPGCTHCEEVCAACEDPCDCTKPHAKVKKFVWTDWIPGCATIHTKKKLMQKVITKKAPSYKWVVEDLCAECEAKAKSASVEPGAMIPPLPDVDAKVIYAEAKLASYTAP
jgi:hypothetical protein